MLVTHLSDLNIDYFLNNSLPSALSSGINELDLEFVIFTTEALRDKLCNLDIKNLQIKTRYENCNKFVLLDGYNTYPKDFFSKLKPILKEDKNIWIPRVLIQEDFPNNLNEKFLLNKIIEHTPNGLFLDHEEFYWKYSSSSILSKIIGRTQLLFNNNNLKHVITDCHDIFYMYKKSFRNKYSNNFLIKNKYLFENNIKIYAKDFKDVPQNVLSEITDLVTTRLNQGIEEKNKILYKDYENYIHSLTSPPPPVIDQRAAVLKKKEESNKGGRRVVRSKIKPKETLKAKSLKKPMRRPKIIVSRNARFK